jgi:RNA-directed DNA polymerase
MLEEILDRRNMEKAVTRVISNDGSGGIDGMQTDELRDYLNTHYQLLRSTIMSGTYKPSPVKKVEIQKEQGGVRMLGIPTVTDRLVQQSIAQWLSPKYEEQFSEQSYGFRPKRNAHQAVMQAKEYIRSGKTYVIEMDLEKFFDKVNHDRLMSVLSKKIRDKRVLQLIRSYLTSGIMEGGIVSQRQEGTPQGSPLSPLLSNIVLDELDKELELRGHSYVRYADDCSIYVRSKKSAERVLTSITKYIEQRLKLKVNREKTKISRPSKSSLLGFSFYKTSKEWEIRISPKSIQRIMKKCKVITSRSNGKSIKEKINQLKPIVTGWINYFVIAKAKKVMQEIDGCIRTRLRMCRWKEWKRPKTRQRNLLELGINKQKAYEWSNSSKGYCRIAHSPILNRSLNNEYWSKQGYRGFLQTYYWRTEKQTSLF